MRTSSLLLTLALLATVGCISPGAVLQDFDGDGSLDADDCAPSDPVVHPGADDDFGDDIDQNCDGVDGMAVDQDLDGYSNAVDCDDEDPAVYPGAPDSHGDDIDSNCDGIDGVAVDQDGDGYSNAVDCDDSDPASYPGADDPLGDDIDQDCDGMDGVAADLDSDGYSNVVDCDDLDPAIYPGAVDVFGDGIDQNCDGVDGVAPSGDDDDSAGDEDIIAPEHCADGLDNDLDGDIDCGDADCVSAAVCLEHCSDGLDNDLDGDTDCADPDCSVAGICQEDCDDGLDNDLDGDTDCADSSCGSAPFCAGDDDDSAEGNGSAPGPLDVDDDTDGFSENQGDCDDTDASNFPGNVEYCDGQDNDCNGVADLTGETADSDNDNVLACADCDDGNATSTVLADDADCDGFVTTNDCDDSAPGTYPGAPDPVDASGLDTDCDLCDPTLPAVVDANGVTHIRGDGIDSDCDGYAQNGVGSDQDCDDSDAAVYPGSTEIWESTLGLLDTNCDGGFFTWLGDAADASFVGEDSGDFSGLTTAAGDVDGDGLGDFLIGAPYNADGGQNAGKSYLFLGASIAAGGTFDLSAADASFVGENPGDISGYFPSTAGDVDGDGLSDILIGAPGYDFGAGKTYLFFGSQIAAGGTFSLSAADACFLGENSGDSSGFSPSTAGDVDGDGLSDLLIGARYNAEGGTGSGKSYLFLGSRIVAGSTFSLDSADASFIGANAHDHSGRVASAGDVDGDGLDDLLIGAPEAEGGRGKSYIFFASTIGSGGTSYLNDADAALVGENAFDSSGQSVSSAGDVDGDGLADLLIGAPNNDAGGPDAGKTYLLLATTIGFGGTFSLSGAHAAFIGENSGDHSGSSIATAGDVDGDGLPDLLIGAMSNEDGGSGAGKTYLVLGATIAMGGTYNLNTADSGFVGESPGDSSGSVASSAGDVNGDGLADMLIGAVGNVEGGGPQGTLGNAAGKTYLLLSTYPTPDYAGLWTLSSAASYSCLSGAVTAQLDHLAIDRVAPYAMVSGVPELMMEPATAQPGLLEGGFDTSANPWPFEVTRTESLNGGACYASWALNGSYTGPDTLSGDFTATFNGSCGDCTNQSFPITATR